ncbi:MAG: hypothetical protein FJ030_12505 [Chloroflexi bacterium]|nr:hypothetical protein [Chloroflexota bacterium]
MIATTASKRIRIGEVVRNAVVFNFRNKREDAMAADSLLQTVAHLFDLLRERQIEYALVGGVAMLQFVEGRNTEDVDLIMAVSSLRALPEIQIESQDKDFARGKFDALQIDILLTSNPLFERVGQQHTAPQPFAEQEIPCATVEGLLLLKLYALPSLYRQGNFSRVGIYESDIAALIHDYRPVLDPLLEILAHHLSTSDIDSLREIVAEIEQRIERFDKNFRG